MVKPKNLSRILNLARTHKVCFHKIYSLRFEKKGTLRIGFIASTALSNFSISVSEIQSGPNQSKITKKLLKLKKDSALQSAESVMPYWFRP